MAVDKAAEPKVMGEYADIMRLEGSLQSFVRSFQGGGSSGWETCHCGRTYLDSDRDLWDRDEEAFEAVLSDPLVIVVDHEIACISIDGRTFVTCCNCWHKSADWYIKWIEQRAWSLIDYFRLEKKRKEAEAASAPLITDHP